MSRGNLPGCHRGVGREAGRTVCGRRAFAASISRCTVATTKAAGQPGSGARGRRAFAEFTSQDQDPQVQTNAPGCRRSGSTAVTSAGSGSGNTEGSVIGHPSSHPVCLILLKQSRAPARCWIRVQSLADPLVLITLGG